MTKAAIFSKYILQKHASATFIGISSMCIPTKCCHPIVALSTPENFLKREPD
jgi:hypothetical protein